MIIIQVEKNIPIPVRKKQGKYPFNIMDVGDSFFSPNISQPSLLGSVCKWKRKNNSKYKFKCADWTEIIEGKEIKGSRVWRIE